MRAVFAWLDKIITEPDNKTPCVVRIMSVAGVAEFLGCVIYTVHKSGTFDMQSFGVGFGGLLAGIGAALKMKKDSPGSDS